MEKKEFKHNKKEICKLTKKSIYTPKESYVILLECNGKEIESIGFYKPEVLKSLILGNLDNVQKEILKDAGVVTSRILNKFLGKKEVYEIA